MQPSSEPIHGTALAAINARLAGLASGPPRSVGPLTVMPLIGPDIGSAPVLGTDALKSGDVVVEEVDVGGIVAELRARNSGKNAALFLLGDELLGGKQHRVVNTHVLIRGGHEVLIPVSCIEAGRWGGVDRSRRGAFLCRREALSVHGDLRGHLARQTHSSLRERGRARSDQGEVWREVDRYSSKRGVRSRTSALSDALADIDSNEGDVTCESGQVGFVAWAGDRLVSLELFGSSETLRGSLQRLVRSAASSSGRFRDREGGSERATGALLARLQEIDWRPFDGVSDGVELRGTLDEAEVVSLVAEDALVALSVLAA